MAGAKITLEKTGIACGRRGASLVVGVLTCQRCHKRVEVADTEANIRARAKAHVDAHERADKAQAQQQRLPVVSQTS